MDWQPIETAPKDGTRIVVWGRVGFRHAIYTCALFSENGREGWEGDAGWFIDNVKFWFPVPFPKEE